MGYLQAVDAMAGQLLRLLWAAEAAGRRRFSVVVCGDHSTPVEFGDHSHEAVPFALAHLRHVVGVLGGEAAVAAVPLGPIPHPTAAPEGDSLAGPLAALDGGWREGDGGAGVASSREGGRRGEEGGRRVAGDAVSEYDEIAAARGALGRFPGSQVMLTIREFAGIDDPV